MLLPSLSAWLTELSILLSVVLTGIAFLSFWVAHHIFTLLQPFSTKSPEPISSQEIAQYWQLLGSLPNGTSTAMLLRTTRLEALTSI
jgi:hypothetical protein